MSAVEDIREVQHRSAVKIRDAIYDRIVPFMSSSGEPSIFTLVRKTAMPTLQPNELPACSIFLLEETEESDGDYNVGFTKYLNDATIGISVARAFDDPDFIRGQLELDVEWIKTMLLIDPTFSARKWPGELFEGVPRMRTVYVLNENVAEAYMGELRLEMTFRYRTGFAALVFDEFREMFVAVRMRHGDAPDVKVLYQLWEERRRRDR